MNTNNELLQYLRGQGKLNKIHAKRVKHLQKFPYDIKQKRGNSNIVVDALSRKHKLLVYLGS